MSQPDNKLSIHEWAAEQDIDQDDFELQVLVAAAAIALSHLDATPDPEIDEVNIVVADKIGLIQISVVRLDDDVNETSINLH